MSRDDIEQMFSTTSSGEGLYQDGSRAMLNMGGGGGGFTFLTKKVCPLCNFQNYFCCQSIAYSVFFPMVSEISI